MRIVSLRVLTAVMVAAIPLVARADNGSLPNSETLQFYQEFLFEVANPASNGGTVAQQPYQQPQSTWTYFNYAHCECASPSYINSDTNGLDVTDPGHHETKFGWKIIFANHMTPAVHLPAEIWTGAMCDDQTDTTIRGSDCTEETYDSIADIDQIYPSGTTPFLNLFDLMTPEPGQHATGECLQRALAGDEWIAASTMQDGVLDFWQSQQVTADTLPPPVPTVFRASSGENAVNLSWDVPDGDISDIYYYQALCSDENGSAAEAPVAAPLYQTSYSLCGATQSGTPLTIAFAGAVPSITNDAGMIDIDAAVGSGSGSGSGSATVRLAGSDAGVGMVDAPLPDGAVDSGIPLGIDASAGAVIPYAGIQQLDPSFICGSTTSATATSMRIEGLTNGVPYHVALLAIDKSGNPAGVYLEATFVPQPVTDFWESLHADGSKVEGGFCLVNDTFGDDSGISNELRAFRDDTLASTGFGRWLTNVYYEDAAPLGERVAGHTGLRIWTGLQLSLPIAVAVAWHHLTLPGLLALCALGLLWRNRRRVLARRGTRIALASGAAALALVVLPGRASAQAQDDSSGSDWQSTSGTAAVPSDPDWQQGGPTAESPPNDPVTDETPAIAPASIDEPIDAESTLEPPRVNWHAGVKVGPYTPQIDAQAGGSKPGPYETMFGSGITVLPVLDVDRVVYHGLGGLFTAGISLGYMGKTANAFTEVLDPATGKYMTTSQRAGDTNSFRLIPISVMAGYRYTQLDDDYGIPFVPYVRAGLAYDVWWIDAPSGNLSKVCTDGMITDNEPGCATNKAAGASAGVVGTIGFAVHAERLDKEAANTMRESGILHAGFYVELSLAKVDGFGSETKLAVGDNTVFAGVDFDF